MEPRELRSSIFSLGEAVSQGQGQGNGDIRVEFQGGVSKVSPNANPNPQIAAFISATYLAT